MSVRILAAADVAFGVLLAAAPWAVLPARVALVDGAAAGVGLLHLAAGVGLLAGRAWAPRLARTAALLLLVLGTLCLAGLAVSASFLSGVYGSIGRGGATAFGVAILVLLPYFIVFPILALLALRSPRPSEGVDGGKAPGRSRRRLVRRGRR